MSNYWATREVTTFDVDKFIADVHQKYEQMAQENPALAAWAKTEEELRKLWDAVLNDRRPGGDASLYPNAHGPQPALMEVWHKAGDFWRAKYRLGDTLLCDQNGAALNPMELGLIAKAKAVVKDNLTTETKEQVYSHHTENENAPAAAGHANTKTNITTDQGAASREARQPIFETEEQEKSAGRKMLRGAGYLAAATLAIIIVYQTGLIIPLGLIGLATSGLLR